jgi:hypothetical protein
MTGDDEAAIRDQLEALERKKDSDFAAEINAVCERYKRVLVAEPLLVPGEGGMKISAQVVIKRVTTA